MYYSKLYFLHKSHLKELLIKIKNKINKYVCIVMGTPSSISDTVVCGCRSAGGGGMIGGTQCVYDVIEATPI